MNVHRSVVGFWETGRKDIRLSTLLRIAEALGVTLGELFTGLESTDLPESPLRSLGRNRMLRDFTVLEEQVQKLKTTVLGEKASGGSETGARPKSFRPRNSGRQAKT